MAKDHNELQRPPPHRGPGDPHTNSYIDYITTYVEYCHINGSHTGFNLCVMDSAHQPNASLLHCWEIQLQNICLIYMTRPSLYVKTRLCKSRSTTLHYNHIMYASSATSRNIEGHSPQLFDRLCTDLSNVLAFGHNELWRPPPHCRLGDPHISSYIDYITNTAI